MRQKRTFQFIAALGCLNVATFGSLPANAKPVSSVPDLSQFQNDVVNKPDVIGKSLTIDEAREVKGDGLFNWYFNGLLISGFVWQGVLKPAWQAALPFRLCWNYCYFPNIVNIGGKYYFNANPANFTPG